MSTRLARLLVQHPLPFGLALAGLTAVAVALAAHIRFDFTPQSVFAGNDDLVTYAEKFKEAFGYDDAVLMVVLEATGEHDALDYRALNWQGEMAAELAALSRVERVQSIATLQMPQVRFGGGGRMETAPLIPQFPIGASGEERVRWTVERSQLLEGSLISRDRRVATLLVAIDPDAREVAEMKPIVESVQAVMKRVPVPDGYRLHLSGLPAIRLDIVNNLQKDQVLLFPVAAGLFLVALGLVFRCVSGTVLPLLAVGIGILWTVAGMVLFGRSFDIISNVLPILLLIIGISNCVHIVTRYMEESQWVEGDRRHATFRTIAHMGWACFLTCLTTAVGFGSLIAARSQALQAFGWQAAMGMGLLYVSMVLTLGLLFPFFRPPRHRGFSHYRPTPVSGILVGASYAVTRHPLATLLCGAALIGGAVWSARSIAINSNMIETYTEEHPTIQTIRLVERELGGLGTMGVSLETDDPERFLDPLVYCQVAEAARFAAGLKGVTMARSYVDLHQEVYANFRRQDELREQLPTLDEEGARQIQRSRSLIRNAGEAAHYGAFMTDDGQRARILIRVKDIGSKETIRLIGQLENKLSELFPPASGVSVRVTGDAYLSAKAMDGFVRDLFYSLLGASAVIFTIIALLFRSFRLGLISTLPNLTPLFLTLGYIGLRGYDMNAGNVMVFAISLGIAVDNTIHFISRFREELGQAASVPDAVARAYQGSGRAVVLTTTLIVSGLAVLLLSDFVPTRRFAELTSLTMLGALVGDLLLLPACLVLFWKKKPGNAVPTPDDPPPDSPPTKRKPEPSRAELVTA